MVGNESGDGGVSCGELMGLLGKQVKKKGFHIPKWGESDDGGG